jgi:hypothetical protein
MSGLPRRNRWIGLGIGLLASLALLVSTGPNPETEFTGNIRRLGGPCLSLEQWGIFGWQTVGQTSVLTQATRGNWQTPSESLGCSDLEDRLILVRMPPDAKPDRYRICGLADDRKCLTLRLVPFESDGPGP